MSKKRYLPERFICVWRNGDKYTTEIGYPTDLIYNIDTKIIYYYFNDKGKRSMCPYYGPNGKPCTIKGSQIVEVC